MQKIINKALVVGILFLLIFSATAQSFGESIINNQSNDETVKKILEESCDCEKENGAVDYERILMERSDFDDEYPPIGERFNFSDFVLESSDTNQATYTLNLGGSYGDTIVAHLETYINSGVTIDKADNITFKIYGTYLRGTPSEQTVNEEYVCGYDDVQDVIGIHDSIYITPLRYEIDDIDIIVNSQGASPLIIGGFIEIRDADKRIEYVGASGDYYVPYYDSNYRADAATFAQQAQSWAFADGYHWTLRARTDLQVYNAKGFRPLEWINDGRKADITYGVSWAGTADTNSAWPGVGEYGYYVGAGFSAMTNTVYGNIHWTREKQQKLAEGGMQMDEEAYLEDIYCTIFTNLYGEVVEEAIGFPFAGEMLDIIQFTIAIMSTDETITGAGVVRYDDQIIDKDKDYFLYIKVSSAARAGGIGTGYVNFLWTGDPFTDLEKTNDYQKGVWMHNSLIYYHPVERPIVELKSPTKTLFRNDESIKFEADITKGCGPYDVEWTATKKSETNSSVISVNTFKSFDNLVQDSIYLYNHSFDEGQFLITVKITDANGGIDTDSTVIEVLAPPDKPVINLTHSEIEEYEVYLLSWDQVDGASHYYVKERRDDQSNYYFYPNQTWTFMPFLKRENDTDHRFQYRVVAVNRLGQESLASDDLVIKINRKPLEIPTVVDLPTQHGSGQVYSVHWERGNGWRDGWQLKEYKWVNLTANQTCYMEKVLINDTKFLDDDCPNEYVVNDTAYCHCDAISHDDENITVYEYQVAEMEKVGQQWKYGPYSRNLSTQIVPPPASAPLLLTPEHTSAWGVYYDIKWVGNVSTATDYYLEEDDDEDFSSPTSKRWLSNSTNFTYFKKNQASDAGTYYYRIRAENREYDQYKMVGPWSNVINKTVVGSGIIPDTPVLYASDDVVFSGDEFTINWNHVDGEQLYKAQESVTRYFLDNETTEWLTNGLHELPIVSFNRTYTRNNTQSYFYRVKGLASGAVEGNWGNIVEVQVIGDKAPEKPPLLDPGSFIERYNSYDISWNAIPNKNIQFYENTDPTFQTGYPHAFASFDGNITNFSHIFGTMINPLMYNGRVQVPPTTTNYFYRIRSYDEHGYSPWSNVVDMQVFAPSGGSPPSTSPTIVTPSQGVSILAANEFWINWTSVVDATFYILQEAEYWAPGPICGWPTSPEYHTYSGPLLDVKLFRPESTDTKQCYRVAAANQYGIGPWSSIITINLTAPPEPDNPDNPFRISDGFISNFDLFLNNPESTVRLHDRLANSVFQEIIQNNGLNHEVILGGRSESENLVGLTSMVTSSVSDLTNDGYLEVIHVQDNESIFVYNRTGQIIQELHNLNQCMGLCVGDYNNDLDNDLIISEYLSGNVTVYNSDMSEQTVLTGFTSPIGVSIGDFNNDGQNDIAIAEYRDGKVFVLDNSGDIIKQYTGIDRPQAVSIADFNHNGYNDLAVTLENGKVEIFFGLIDNRTLLEDCERAYDPYSEIILDADCLYVPIPYKSDYNYANIGYNSLMDSLISPLGTSIGDFYDDGVKDIAITNPLNVKIFNEFGIQVQSIPIFGSIDTSIGDYNNDNFNDIAISSFEQVIVYSHDITPIQTFSFPGVNPRGIMIGDYDNNLLNDIVISLPGEIQIYDSNGDLVDTIPAVDPQGVSLDDFNEDGFNDLFVFDDLGGSYSLKLFYGENRPYLPSNPFPPDKDNGASRYISLAWEGGDPDSEDIVTYDVYFGTDPNPPLVSENQLELEFDPGLLENKTTYYWKIDSEDDAGLFTKGRIWQFETNENSAPHEPNTPTPQDDDTEVSIDIQLSWIGDDPDSEDIVTYDVYFGTQLPLTLVSEKQTGTNYGPGTLETDSTYYWQIISYDNYDISKAGPVWNFDTIITSVNTPPYPPANPDPDDELYDISIDHDIAWSGGDPDFGDFVTYDVYFGTTNPPPQVGFNQTGSIHELDVLEYETEYFWKIVSWDSFGESSAGSIWSFTTEPEFPDPSIVYVDDDYYEGGYNDGHTWGYDAFDNIQEGIDAVEETGTVIVKEGIYFEHISVDKTIDLIGENQEQTIVDGSGSERIISIQEDNVHIQDLTLQNGGSEDEDACLFLDDVEYTTINTITVTTTKNGIILSNSSHTSINEIYASLNNDDAIEIYQESNYNNIENSEFYENGAAVFIYGGRFNTIQNNIISDSTAFGIQLYDDADNNTISNNTISGTTGEMYPDDIDGDGICLFYYSSLPIQGCLIENNNIYGNIRGITFRQTQNSIIRYNKIENSTEIGIKFFTGVNDNKIYHNNILSNLVQAEDIGNNIWDNDYPSGGNYWSDYTGVDENGDGIGDTPYSILGGSNIDRYPLMLPLGLLRTYLITNIGIIGETTNASYGYGLNEQGQVVGSSGEEYGLQEAYIWENQTITPLGTLGGLWSKAEAINATGIIAGSSHTDEWRVRGFIDDNHVIEPTDEIGVLPDGNVSYAHDINDLGYIVGTSYVEPDQWQPPHAFLYHEDTEMIDLGVISSYNSSVAYSLNNDNIVVGTCSITDDYGTHSQAFIWNETVGMIPLETPIGAINSYAYDINDVGQVVGYFVDSTGQHAYLWENNAVASLPSLDGPKIIARAINNNGQIVGSALNSQGDFHAVLWEDEEIYDLNDLLLPGSEWELIEAYDINDNGQIIGHGMIDDNVRAFLLNPYRPSQVWITDPMATNVLYESNWSKAMISDDLILLRSSTLDPADLVYSTEFSYSDNDGQSWIPINIDYSGEFIGELLPSGQNPMIGDMGWTGYWDSSMLPEGEYLLRAVMDTPSGLYEDTRKIMIDRTPPVPTIVTPPYNEQVQGVFDIEVICDAPDVVQMEVLHFIDETQQKSNSSGWFNQTGHGTVDQHDVGENDSTGMNRFCAPTALANALKIQNDKRLYPPDGIGNDTYLAITLIPHLMTTPWCGTLPWVPTNEDGNETTVDMVGSGIKNYLESRGVGCSNKNGYTVKSSGISTKKNTSTGKWYPRLGEIDPHHCIQTYADAIKSKQSVMLYIMPWDWGPDGVPGIDDDSVDGGHFITGRGVNTGQVGNYGDIGTTGISFVDPNNGQTDTGVWHEELPGLPYMYYPKGSQNRFIIAGMWIICPKNQTKTQTTSEGVDSNPADGLHVSINSLQYDNGHHLFFIQTTDSEGFIGTQTLQVNVQNTGVINPEVWITDPSPSSYMRDPLWQSAVIDEDIVTLRANCVNGSSPILSTMFEYSSDGENWQYLGTDDYEGFEGALLLPTTGLNRRIGTEGWTHLWDISSLPEGDYQLRATMTDAGGRTGEIIRPIHLDRTPPTVSYLQPDYLEPVSGNIEFRTQSPAMDIESMDLYYIDYNPQKIDMGPGWFEQTGIGTMKQSEIGENGADGKNRFCGPAAATNALKGQGNSLMYPWGAPDDDQALGENLSELMNTDPDEGTTPWVDSGGPNDEKEIDSYGSAIEAWLEKQGIGCSNFVSGYEVKHRGVKMRNNSGKWYPAAGSNKVSFKFINDELRRGQSVIIFKVPWDWGPDDQPGTGDDSISPGHFINVNGTNSEDNPAGTHDIGYFDPEDGGWWTGTMGTEGGFCHLDYELIAGVWSISPKDWSSWMFYMGPGSQQGPEYFVSVDTTQFSDGYHSFCVEMTDTQNFTGMDTITIHIDNTPPDSRILPPGGTIYPSDPITIFADDFDGSGIDHIHYEIYHYGAYVDDGVGFGEEYTLILDSYGIIEGPVEIIYYAVDNAQNVGPEHNAYFTVEQFNPPEVWITSPIADSYIYEPTWQTAVISQDLYNIRAEQIRGSENITETTFYYSLNGIDWIYIGSDNNCSFDGFYFSEDPTKELEDLKIGDEGWTTFWNTTQIPEGNCYLKATMIDSLGYSGECIRQIHIDNQPPIPNIVYPSFDEFVSGDVEFFINTDDPNAFSMQGWLYDYPGLKTRGNGFQQSGLGNLDGHNVGKGTCSPTAAANALTGLGDNRVFPDGQEGNLTALAEGLASAMGTDDNGTNAFRSTGGPNNENETDSVGSGIESWLESQGIGCSNDEGYEVTVYRVKIQKNDSSNTWYPVDGSNQITYERFEEELRNNEKIILGIRPWDNGDDSTPGTSDDSLGSGHAVTGSGVAGNQGGRNDEHGITYIDPEDGGSHGTTWGNQSTAGGHFSWVQYDFETYLVTGMWVISPKQKTAEYQEAFYDSSPNGGFVAMMDTTQFEDGTYPITVELTDQDGFIGQDLTVINIDNTLPESTISPLDGSIISLYDIISISTNDFGGSGVENIHIDIIPDIGEPVHIDILNDNYEFTLVDHQVDPEQWVDVFVIVTDRAGNPQFCPTMAHYMVDNQAPISDVMPLGGIVTPEETIELSATDGMGIGVDSIYYIIHPYSEIHQIIASLISFILVNTEYYKNR